MAFIGLGTTFAYDARYEVAISGITQADPGVVTVSDLSDFADGDIVLINNIVGMTQLNGGYYKVANKAGSTFELTDLADNDVDTSGFSAYVSGGTIELIDDADPDYQNIGEINDLQPPSPTKETVDTTHMGSTGGYREFISGLKDGGEVTFNMNFSYADYLVFKNNFEDDLQPRKYRVQFPDDAINKTTWYFSAVVTDIPVTAPTGDKVTADITLKISGKSTLTNNP
jgi:predicted secreted protein